MASCRGTRSISIKIVSNLNSRASDRAAFASGPGTRITSESIGPWAAQASLTVLYTGISHTFCPARPGVTPATRWVPVSSMFRAMNCPNRPVIPWIRTFVPFLIMIDNGFTSHQVHSLPVFFQAGEGNQISDGIIACGLAGIFP